MKNLKLKSDPRVQPIFEKYPTEAIKQMRNLRQLILDTASEMEETDELEETLKWGEPSYLAKKGSTIRIDWKAKTPNQYAIYFKCTSKLVETFKHIYGNQFNYEKNRAIIFQLNEEIPKKELKHCISLALNYHRIKNLPWLGT